MAYWPNSPSRDGEELPPHMQAGTPSPRRASCSSGPALPAREDPWGCGPVCPEEGHSASTMSRRDPLTSCVGPVLTSRMCHLGWEEGSPDTQPSRSQGGSVRGSLGNSGIELVDGVKQVDLAQVGGSHPAH